MGNPGLDGECAATSCSAVRHVEVADAKFRGAFGFESYEELLEEQKIACERSLNATGVRTVQRRLHRMEEFMHSPKMFSFCSSSSCHASEVD